MVQKTVNETAAVLRANMTIISAKLPLLSPLLLLQLYSTQSKLDNILRHPPPSLSLAAAVLFTVF